MPIPTGGSLSTARRRRERPLSISTRYREMLSRHSSPIVCPRMASPSLPALTPRVIAGVERPCRTRPLSRSYGHSYAPSVRLLLASSSCILLILASRCSAIVCGLLLLYAVIRSETALEAPALLDVLRIMAARRPATPRSAIIRRAAKISVTLLGAGCGGGGSWDALSRRPTISQSRQWFARGSQHHPALGLGATSVVGYDPESPAARSTRLISSASSYHPTRQWSPRISARKSARTSCSNRAFVSSVIARAITGTRWNGWVFWGLKNHRRAA